jgi:hypothetical protein
MLSIADLSNPAPSQGQSRPFGPMPGKGPRRTGGTGPPSFQEFLNPNLSNTHGRTSNPTVSYPFLTRPFRGSTARPKEGEIVFTVRQAAKKAGAGFLITVLPISFLNEILYDAAAMLSAESTIGMNTLTSELNALNKGYDRSGQRVGLASKLNFLGVLRNEAIAPSRHQQLINVDVRGRTRIRNYWGKDVATGHRLYIRMERTNTANYGLYRPNGRTPAMAQSIIRITAHTGLELAEEGLLESTDATNIFIGTAMNTVHRVSSDDRSKSAIVRADRAYELDFIEVALKVAGT